VKNKNIILASNLRAFATLTARETFKKVGEDERNRTKVSIRLIRKAKANEENKIFRRETRENHRTKC
jgi:hypothetical protein